MKKITLQTLVDLNACEDQRDLFAKTFPKGTTVTLAACKKAAIAGLQLGWLAERLFTPAQRKAYNEATAAAWEAYHEATAPAREACNEVEAVALWNAWQMDHPEISGK